MKYNKETINIVWFKRDLRLEDNEAIYNSLHSDFKVLLLYVFEPLLIQDPHYSKRHWDFIKESIIDINLSLDPYNTKILTLESDIIAACNQIQNHYRINTIYSHKETGISVTYDRDKTFTRYCKNNFIQWEENNNNGVQRGLTNRTNWIENWNTYMDSEIFQFSPKSDSFLNTLEIDTLESYFQIPQLNTEDQKLFQKGGTKMAWKYADTFFHDRHKSYMFNISKPHESRTSCSRLSPYISWGNVSVRQIYQSAKRTLERTNNKRQLNAFISRLRWQAHFIQKFEMEDIMEKASINKGYHKLKKSISEDYQTAWREGQTGFPLVDASMRCLNTTGYINFRMRALLVSFFTHILWQPWQDASQHLSRNFLDFEPGIHFPQLQMQAGETGINNPRIYNPIKNSIDHDAEAVFIKKWVPELAHLDLPFVHEPYLMTTLEQQFYNFKLGEDYPAPIVDVKSRRKHASDILWSMRNQKLVQKENERILAKHTLKDRSRLLRNKE